jgi:hypothetical protein
MFDSLSTCWTAIEQSGVTATAFECDATQRMLVCDAGPLIAGPGKHPARGLAGMLEMQLLLAPCRSELVMLAL